MRAETAPRRRETLRKYEILRGHGAVERVLSQGRKFPGVYVTLFYLPGQTKQVAFIAARRYRKAVLRNRIKRLLREVYRKNKDLFAEGLWVLYGRFTEPIPSYQQVEEDVLRTAKLAKVELEKDD